MKFVCLFINKRTNERIEKEFTEAEIDKYLGDYVKERAVKLMGNIKRIELFGDEAYNFSTTPELQNVIPGLIETDTRYAAKELSKGREAATGRSFRSPVPRS